jgi:RNA polymerase sigma-70 factor (ECF subfamily)
VALHTPPVDRANGTFEELFRSVHPDLVRYFIRRLGPEEAQDAAAETMTAILAKWDKAPSDLDQQRAWAFGFAVNKLREAERRRIRDSKLAVAAEIHTETTVASHDAAIAGLDRARDLLAQLPQAERDAVYLTAIVGLTSAQAGQALGCSQSAVTTRVSRGKNRLRELLIKETEGGQR